LGWRGRGRGCFAWGSAGEQCAHEGPWSPSWAHRLAPPWGGGNVVAVTAAYQSQDNILLVK